VFATQTLVESKFRRQVLLPKAARPFSAAGFDLKDADAHRLMSCSTLFGFRNKTADGAILCCQWVKLVTYWGKLFISSRPKVSDGRTAGAAAD
jgi:hypothetical protein